MSTDVIKKENDKKSEMKIKDCNDEGKKMNPGLRMSARTESSSNADQNPFQRFHNSNQMSSNISFCDLPTEDNVSSGSIVDTKELLLTLAGYDRRYADQKQSERQRFYSSEDYIKTESNANQDKAVYSSESADLIEVKTDDADQNEKTKSDIFFCDLLTEDNVSSGSIVDTEELLLTLAGYDRRYADEKQSERQRFYSSPDDYIQTKSNANQDKAINLPETGDLTEVETDNADENQTQKHYCHEKTSSDIFFRHLPTEGDVSSGSTSVDREDILFPSAGHDTRDADQKQGERRHFHSSSEDYMQPESNTN